MTTKHQSKPQAQAEQAQAEQALITLTPEQATQTLTDAIDYGAKLGQIRSTISRAIFFNGSPTGIATFGNKKVKISGAIFENAPDDSYLRFSQEKTGILGIAAYLSVKLMVGNLSVNNIIVAKLLKSLADIGVILPDNVAVIRDSKEYAYSREHILSRISVLLKIGEAVIKEIQNDPILGSREKPKPSHKSVTTTSLKIDFE